MSIEQELDDLKKRFEQLESKVKANIKSEEWPANGEIYFSIDFDCGEVESNTWYNCNVDRFNRVLGNVFKTREEALNEHEYRLVVTELRNTKGRVDPFKSEQRIYGISALQDIVDVSEDIWEFGLAWPTPDLVQNAIDKVGQSRIIRAAMHAGRL